jgi:hypothetical protein
MSKLDWENRIIIGKSGTVYKILPEKISVGRWPKYELWSTLLTVRMDSSTFLQTLDDIESKTSKATTIGQIVEPLSQLRDLKKGVLNYLQTGRSQLSEFASIFCFKCDKDGNIIEDIGDITEDVIRDKHNDWKEIDHYDFFLLVFRHIPKWQENYRLELERERAEKG